MSNAFTPEQIAQILEEFFKTVGTRQYIGMRYVPLFGRKDETSIDWDNSAPYEPLTVVIYQGNSYTSRQYVPAGVDITNEAFWALTFNFNAQVELYRRETARALQAAQDAQSDIDTLLPKSSFTSENTVKNYIDGAVREVQNDIDTLLPKSAFSAENTVKAYIDNLADVIPSDDFSESDTVKKYIDNKISNISLLPNKYLGRISYIESAQKATGACTLLSDDILIFTACNNGTTNDVDIYTINLNSKAITSKVTKKWCHANGICYDSHTNKIIVSPNYDYEANQRLNSIYICNATTFDIEDVHTFDFEPHSVAYDKDNNKIYIIGTPETSIYEFNTADGTATLVKTITSAEMLQNVESESLFGWQDSSFYNGSIYNLRSDNDGVLIIKIPIKDEPLKFFTFDRHVGSFVDPEPEGITFNSYGNAVISGCSYNVTGSTQYFGTIYELPINTTIALGNIKTDVSNAKSEVVYLNGSLGDNYTIMPDGTEQYPYPTFVEAYMGMSRTMRRRIMMVGDTELNYTGGFICENFEIAITNGSVLTVGASAYVANARFTGGTTHGVIRRKAGFTGILLNLFLTCTFRQVDFDFIEDTSTLLQGRTGFVEIMDSVMLNNSGNAILIRAEGGGVLHMSANTTARVSNYTGKIYPQPSN